MVVKVSPGAKNPTHDISLSDGVQTWGLRLDGGPRAIQEIPQTPSTIHFTGGGTKFGDWEPGYSHLEQRTWYGGRGSDDFSLDPTRFYDSMMANTLIDGAAFPAPQWKFASGLRTTHENLPGDMDWQAVLDNQIIIASRFTVGASSFPIDNVKLWIRRIGSPNPLTVQIWTDDGSDRPNNLFPEASTTVDTDQFTDLVSIFHKFDLSAASSLTALTKYHVFLYGNTYDNAANHWEVGVDADGGASTASGPGNNANLPAAFSLYYRVSDTDIKRKWHFFELQGAQYAMDQREDGVNSSVYMNGERGKATTAGGNNTLTDSANGIKGAWVDDEWNGWYIRVRKGTGKGQWRKIIDTTSAGVITVDKDWDKIPNTDSHYVIYGGDAWQDVSPSGGGDLIDSVVKSVAVLGWKAYFAQGAGAYILRMQYKQSPGTPTHEFADDGTNIADILYVDHDTVDGPQMIRILNATWANKSEEFYRANAQDWGTNLSFGSAIKIHHGEYLATNVISFDGHRLIFKTDGLYTHSNDRIKRLNVGLDFIISENNGEAAIAHNSYLYFSWGEFSLQRMVGRDLASVGPNRGVGLPDGRKGAVVALASHPEGLFACLDAGESGTSSVLVYNDERLGWHEVFRAWDTGARVQNIAWQINPGTRPRMWLSAGGEIVYQEWPQNTFNPLQDSGMNFQHETVLVSADIDMGAARLPKFIKELTLISENLTTGIETHLEYQVDEQVGGDTWTSAGTFYVSPEDTLPLHRGDVRKIRYRLRMLTNDADVPPVIRATILEAFARTPLKYQWNMRVKVGDNQMTLVGGKDHDPDAFTRWLKDAARQAKRIRMRAVWEEMDDKFVIVEPPTLLRTFTNRILGWWGGSQTLTIREA